MLETYIKNRGATKTIIHNNNRNNVQEIKWDADFDGNTANISLDLGNNGAHNKYHFALDSDDLANILNVNSINLPLELRLKRDFKKTFRNKPKIYQIQFDNIRPQSLLSSSPSYEEYIEPIVEKPAYIEKPNIFEELLTPINTHLSSPKQNEELIIPMTIDEKTLDKFTFTPRRQHRRLKTHKTYKAYKHKKSSSRSKNKSKSKTSKLFTLL